MLHCYFPIAASAAQQKGAQVVLQWADAASIPGIAAAQFVSCFFSGLCTASVTLAEAYALAGHAVQAHCTTHLQGVPHVPPLPVLYAPGQKPLLPHASTIPPPELPEGVLMSGLEPAVDGKNVGVALPCLVAACCRSMGSPGRLGSSAAS